MKAFVCFNGYAAFHDWCLLVLAENKNKARHMVKSEFGDYAYTYARRVSKYDGLSETPCVFWSNDELPEGTEPFYDLED